MTGDLGESVANIFLSKKTSQGHLFRTSVIAGKWPAIDIYAEVVADITRKMFCFFQIKATERGYTPRERKLKVAISVNNLVRLSQYAAPTYLVGVDHNAAEPFLSKAYIGTIRGNYDQSLNSLPTNYPLTDANLIMLQSEIIAYWTTLNPLVTKANYSSNFII